MVKDKDYLKTLNKNLELGLYIFTDLRNQIHMTLGYTIDDALGSFTDKEEKHIIGGLVPLKRFELDSLFKKLNQFEEKPKFKKITVVSESKPIDNKKQFFNELSLACDKFIKKQEDKEAIKTILSKI